MLQQKKLVLHHVTPIIQNGGIVSLISHANYGLKQMTLCKSQSKGSSDCIRQLAINPVVAFAYAMAL